MGKGTMARIFFWIKEDRVRQLDIQDVNNIKNEDNFPDRMEALLRILEKNPHPDQETFDGPFQDDFNESFDTYRGMWCTGKTCSTGRKFRVYDREFNAALLGNKQINVWLIKQTSSGGDKQQTSSGGDKQQTSSGGDKQQTSSKQYK
ncbi:uncharacterized protein LOC104265602 [Ciona intestinalis]